MKTGHPGFLAELDPGLRLRMSGGDEEVAKLQDEDRRIEAVLQLWRGLSVLPRNYEDVFREWFLPTALGYSASYE